MKNNDVDNKNNSSLEGDDDMSTMAMERASLKDFIKQNKKKIYEIAETNVVRNSKGQATISKDDPYFNEDEWEEHFKRMDSKE